MFPAHIMAVACGIMFLLVKADLQLEQLRFNEKMNVIYCIRTMAFLLPALSIQPLVENAVKHGICPKRGGGMLIASRTYLSQYVLERNFLNEKEYLLQQNENSCH